MPCNLDGKLGFVLFVHQLCCIETYWDQFYCTRTYLQGHMYYASIFFVKNCTALFLLSYQLGSQGA